MIGILGDANCTTGLKSYWQIMYTFLRSGPAGKPQAKHCQKKISRP